MGRRVHVGARDLGMFGPVAGQLRDDGDVLRGRRPRHPCRACPQRGRGVRRDRALPLLVGVGFGFFLTASGLGDYRTIHRGLLLEDPYIYLMMAATIGTALPCLWLLRGRMTTLRLPHESPERRHVLGGALFGVGFGVCATCPGITIAMA